MPSKDNYPHPLDKEPTPESLIQANRNNSSDFQFSPDHPNYNQLVLIPNLLSLLILQVKKLNDMLYMLNVGELHLPAEDTTHAEQGVAYICGDCKKPFETARGLQGHRMGTGHKQ